MNLLMIGINFRTAPLTLREKISFSEKQVSEMLSHITKKFPDTEAAILSTCNRTELYVASPDITKQKDILVDTILEANILEKNDDTKQHFIVKEQAEAAKHLMTVTSSLDSMVIGETEILGQVKKAYKLAMKAKSAGKVLHRLFQRAIRAGKRIHTETDICRGRVSISSVAVEFAGKVFDNLSSKAVMVVGAGEMSETTLKNLIKHGVKDITVLNRSIENGKRLAERYDGKAMEFDLLEEALHHADIIISSTNAPHCVIKTSSIKNAVKANHGRPILLIDIAVPRDIEEEAGKLENVYLYNIDDLQNVAQENLARRQEAVNDAKKIIDKEFAELASDHKNSGKKENENE